MQLDVFWLDSTLKFKIFAPTKFNIFPDDKQGRANDENGEVT